ncbi:methyl transferase-like protein [Colletotrichum truncatum]|uniref:Methyl transferase-like protein n=1 Tax=Colletotrichum truncatum TaxID=5467 RepID=A0ACC3YQB4_COLTU|nr:methyl transferase-like protein [Colletotrichum truncatum]KAF6782792.1 methyl transferase-like protein [Colletotrichum truncatum]
MASSTRPGSDVPDMNLYKLDRVHRTLEQLKDKPMWDAEDTGGFDCMHYLGNAAIDNAARQLGLKPGDRVLDIGSGFGGTGRYLYRHYGVETTGIELQGDIHDIATTINNKSGAAGRVSSIHGNFLELSSNRMGVPVDHIVSFLCILHIPEREALFKKALEMLKVGGGFYIEDFFARTALDDKTLSLLRESVSCPDLPDRQKYEAELTKAGFEVAEWVDISDTWADFVHHRAGHPSVDTDLITFYNAVDEVFASGKVGGVRITCRKI